MTEQDNPEKKKLYNIYALFGVSLATSVIPTVSGAVLCLIFFTWLLIAAYRWRKTAEEHSLVHNHSVYIIRSIWIGVLISVVTMIVASLYMLGGIDYAAFNPCIDKITGYSIEALEAMGFAEFYPLAEPCVDGFISANYNILIVSVAIAAGPPLLYLSYRFIKGVSRAVKGYRLANPTSWL